MVSEVADHGHLVPSLWASSEAKHQGGDRVAEQSCSPHDTREAETEAGEREKTGTKYPPGRRPSYSFHHLPVVPPVGTWQRRAAQLRVARKRRERGRERGARRGREQGARDKIYDSQ